jgi:hypothetical protein
VKSSELRYSTWIGQVLFCILLTCSPLKICCHDLFPGKPDGAADYVAQLLPNSHHTLELIPVGDGETVIDAIDTLEPPMK